MNEHPLEFSRADVHFSNRAPLWFGFSTLWLYTGLAIPHFNISVFLCISVVARLICEWLCSCNHNSASRTNMHHVHKTILEVGLDAFEIISSSERFS